MAENATAVVTVTASDPDDADSITGYLLSGTEAALFSISSAGQIAFQSAPDYENPSDGDGNNVHAFTVTFTSGSGDRELTADQEVTVTFTNVVDTPPQVAGVELGANRSVGENEAYVEGDVLTITVPFDADVAVTGTPQFKLQMGTPHQTKARRVDCVTSSVDRQEL